MKYLAVLGRQPEISIAELEAQFSTGFTGVPFPPSRASVDRPQMSSYVDFKQSPVCVVFESSVLPDINRFGGVLKFAEEMKERPIDYLWKLPEGKITLGVSDYSQDVSRRTATSLALGMKKILVRHGRSVRVVENSEAVLSTATSLHNGLSGRKERKVELLKCGNAWYRVVGVQDIDAYARRDQARPARDAKVGMLPPKLAQILINLCGPLQPGAVVLDPFCGTGVILQEAFLMGYRAYGTDITPRMVEFSKKNLEWLRSQCKDDRSSDTVLSEMPSVDCGDATSYQWRQPIGAVACEGYLGKPFSEIPTEMELKEQSQECRAIVVGFLKNLETQVAGGTPVVIAVPAWLRPDGHYERLFLQDNSARSGGLNGGEGRGFCHEIRQEGRLFRQEKVDEINNLGYNVDDKVRKGLLYYREGQIVARDILILRKK